jgi:hypothetical protein
MPVPGKRLKQSKPVTETDLPWTPATNPPLSNRWPSIGECSNKIRDKYYGQILENPSALLPPSNAAYYFNALVTQKAFGPVKIAEHMFFHPCHSLHPENDNQESSQCTRYCTRSIIIEAFAYCESSRKEIANLSRKMCRRTKREA